MSRWHPRTLAQSALSKIELGPACWEWRGKRQPNGYGKLWIRGLPGDGQGYAHRVVYELLVGPIPVGLDLDHLCRNRGCVNPAHLEPVTRRTNLVRGQTIPARKVAQTHCVRGHLFDKANTCIRRNGTRLCRACGRLRSRGAT